MKPKNLITIILLLTVFINANAQSGAAYQGSWGGTLHVGQDLRIVFHIKDNGKGGLVTTADSPDQSALGLKCDTTWVSSDGITIQMRAMNASFTGKLQSDSVLEGTFRQGMDFPLTLKKSGGRKRPQEPKPPFPYKSEDVIYNNTDGSLQYGATITIPSGSGTFPAVLLITGSGAQNRDEEILGHKPFAVLADALTRNGFVVLRVDDRGVGKSTGKFGEATSADFAEDVNTSLNYLRNRPEVNKKKLGLIGHSEGGLIAPMVASKRDDVNFIVLLAGPGVRITQLMAEQNAALLRTSGVPEKAVQLYINIYLAAWEEILAAPDSITARNRATAQIASWAAKTDSATLAQLGFTSQQVLEKSAESLVSLYQNKWYRYFMQFDPQPYLQSLKCKVLALNGSKDIQVISSSNLAGIEAALKKSKSKQYTVKELPGLNHLFQTCTTCTLADYGELEESFSPIALEEINNWLNKNVK